MTKMLRISAKRDGYRRCGVEHSGTVDHAAGIFTDEKIKILKADPLLIVQEVDEGAAMPAKQDAEVARLRAEAAADRKEAAKVLEAAKKTKAEADKLLAKAKKPAEVEDPPKGAPRAN